MRSPSHGMLLAGSALAWLAGVGAQLQQPWLWPVATYGWLSAAGGAASLLAFALRRRAAWPVALAVAAGTALAGFAITGLHATARLVDALAPALEGRDLAVTGIIASLPQAVEAGWRFRFDVEDAALDGQAVVVPQTIALGWYRGAHEDAALLQPGAELRAGQRWRFGVRLRRPHGNANPHGFDYELYLFEQGVRATGYVRDAPAPLRLHDAAGHPVDRLRQRVRDAIAARVADAQTAGILAALAVGDQAAIAGRGQ